MRDHNQEYQDSAERQYAYDFDGIIRKYLLRTLAPYFKRDQPALELGCYKGDMTAQILEYFSAITVVEAAHDLAQIVQARFQGRAKVINASFEEVRLDGTYANIFIVHTLEHLDAPVAILAKVREWLAAGGHLFVAVPNANALSRQI